MKLLKPLLAVMVIAVCWSCQKKDTEPDFTITQQDTKLKFDQNLSLTASLGDNQVAWSSSDEFVGTVDAKGKFVAKHIGETTITATWNGRTAVSKITVEPYTTGIAEPYLGFGANKATIKSNEKRSLGGEDVTSLLYDDGSKYTNAAIYLFENNMLVSAGLIFKATTQTLADDIAKYYIERYQIVMEDNNIYYFTDKDAKVLVGITVNDQLGLIAVYQKNTLTNKSSFHLNPLLKQRGVSNVKELDKYFVK